MAGPASTEFWSGFFLSLGGTDSTEFLGEFFLRIGGNCLHRIWSTEFLGKFSLRIGGNCPTEFWGGIVLRFGGNCHHIILGWILFERVQELPPHTTGLVKIQKNCDEGQTTAQICLLTRRSCSFHWQSRLHHDSHKCDGGEIVVNPAEFLALHYL